MLDLVLVVPGVMLTAVGVLVIAWRGKVGALRVSAGHDGNAGCVSRAICIRNISSLLTVIAGTAVIGGAVVLGAGAQQLASLEAVIPAMSLLLSATGIAWFAYVPRFTEQLTSREASLEVRGLLAFAPRKQFVRAGIAAAVLVTIVAIMGSVADPGGDTIAMTGPFPGRRYGGVTLIAAFLLTGVVAAVLYRLAQAPRPSDAILKDADRALRVAAVDAVLTGFTTAVSGTVGFTLVMAGMATTQAATGSIFDEAGQLLPAEPALGVAGTVELILAGIALITTVVLLVRTIRLLTRPIVFVAAPSRTDVTSTSLQGAL